MRTLRVPSLKGILVSLSTVVVLAGATVAGARGVFFVSSVDEGPTQVEEPQEDPVECAVDDPEGEEQLPDEGCDDDGSGDGGDPEGDDDGNDDGDEQEGDGDRRLASPERQAACMAAADVEEYPLPEGKRTGLENALGRVLENCLKNPEATGLVNALERLAENRARKAARDEVRIQRREERDARKAAKRSEREAKAPKGGGGSSAAAGGAKAAKGSGGPPPHADGPPAVSGGGKGKAKGKG